MDCPTDRSHAGISKRIRQACANCRRKKTKCSGERPICSHCRRGSRPCVYEPYSTTVGDGIAAGLPASADNMELLERISKIESILGDLGGGSSLEARSNFPHRTDPENPGSTQPNDALNFVPGNSSQSGQTTLSYDTLPPWTILCSLVDTYFTYAHNQPYSYFHEGSFRQQLGNNALPKCLVFAVLSMAVRFSDHEYFSGKVHKASDAYSRQSWLSVLADYLTAEDDLNLQVVQTVNLLAVVDYTAGRVSSGWLKIGLAARISQDLHLMSEPPFYLPPSTQEEWRRTFWSIYLVDKLISCARQRPLAILDEECHVQLPCDEHAFQAGEWKKTSTLQQLLSWNTTPAESPSPFALTILMASVFGRCTRYVHQRNIADDIPVWDAKSEFSAANSSLLLLEPYLKIGTKSVVDVISENAQTNRTIDGQQAGHLVFSQALFHLCHCLLNHPFLLHLRLKPFRCRTTDSFTLRAFQVVGDHAKQLTDLLTEATAMSNLGKSSFYAYCVTIAGGIHSLKFQYQWQNGDLGQYEMQRYFEKSIDVLERLANNWPMVSHMVPRMREFHAQCPQNASLFDPACLIKDLDPASEQLLWSVVDYGILAGDPLRTQAWSMPSFCDLPSPTPSALAADALAMTSSEYNTTPTNISVRNADLFGLL